MNFVSHHAVYYSRMFSTMGWNVQYYCERFGGRLSLHDVINSSKKRTVLAVDDIATRAGMIQKLDMVRDGLLCLSGNYFAPADVDALIAQLVLTDFLNSGFYLFCIYYIFMSVFCVLRVRSSCK